MEHKIYEFVTVAIIFFFLAIAILVANLFISISTRKENIKRDAKKNVRLNELSGQIEEIKGLFKADVKYILERIKDVLKQTK